MNSYLRFNTVSSVGEADIIIEQGVGDWAGDCAEATFPLNGNPGNSIIIDESEVVGSSSNHDQMVFLIAHEIGHCLGLRHTNWHTSEWPGIECQNCPHPDDPSVTVGAVQINGTPSTDNNSVYNKATCGYHWNGLSYYDIKGLQALYPALSVSISGFDCLPRSGSASWIAHGINGNGNYTYKWIYLIRRGTQKISGTVYNSKLTLTFQPGDSFSAGVIVSSGGETATGNTGPGFLVECTVSPY